MKGSVVTRIAPAETARARARFATTLGAAALLHAGLVLVDSRSEKPRTVPRARLEVDLIEVLDTVIEEEHERESVPAATSLPERASARTARAPIATAHPAAPESAAALEPSAGPAAPETSARGEGDAAPKRSVRLFLSARDLKEMTEGSLQAAEPRSQPSVGLLREGLEAIDAEKGFSPSSPQVSAGYRAAAHGPEAGTAVFEVRTDGSGVVTSVRIIGGQGESAWAAVASEWLRRLKEQRMRVPEGSRGLVTRLRIDRGSLAEALSERGKTKRGVALGQDRHAKDFGWDESTQASTTPGRMAPSLGISSESLSTPIKTRVTLLSQSAL